MNSDPGSNINKITTQTKEKLATIKASQEEAERQNQEQVREREGDRIQTRSPSGSPQLRRKNIPPPLSLVPESTDIQTGIALTPPGQFAEHADLLVPVSPIGPEGPRGFIEQPNQPPLKSPLSPIVVKREPLVPVPPIGPEGPIGFIEQRGRTVLQRPLSPTPVNLEPLVPVSPIGHAGPRGFNFQSDQPVNYPPPLTPTNVYQPLVPVSPIGPEGPIGFNFQRGPPYKPPSPLKPIPVHEPLLPVSPMGSPDRAGFPFALSPTRPHGGGMPVPLEPQVVGPNVSTGPQRQNEDYPTDNLLVEPWNPIQYETVSEFDPHRGDNRQAGRYVSEPWENPVEYGQVSEFDPHWIEAGNVANAQLIAEVMAILEDSKKKIREAVGRRRRGERFTVR